MFNSGLELPVLFRVALGTAGDPLRGAAEDRLASLSEEDVGVEEVVDDATGGLRVRDLLSLFRGESVMSIRSNNIQLNF